jgi:c(7)-type cytochrome triheme protein
MAPEKLQKLLVRGVLLAPAIIVLAVTIFTEFTWTGYWATQDQPIPYPHDKHIAAGIQCQYCHRGTEDGYKAGIPSVTDCWQCHRGMAGDKASDLSAKPDRSNLDQLRPGVKTLIKDYVDEHREIRWFKYYDMPEHVKFPHKIHINAGLDCTECHGDVASYSYENFEMKQKPTMGWCVACHRDKGASQDCTACHQ